ncbi:MAG TPA: hypothetical protein VFZ09_24220 [Archangium sp.]|uniref:hypothetical protein n=1 Tax=Archangium sp. TaxID=1872627 RepID=UPI002E363F6A|nr:hypothetical protein [Archangium sp.]HEX5749356.1 hypothetical protein [Archangium sp.]
MSRVPRLAVRVLSLLFSAVVVGGLVGFGWGRLAEEVAPAPVERVVPDEARPVARRGARTPEEEAVLERALSAFPPYPRGSRPEVLAADYLGPDAPVAVAWFSTEDAPDQVLSHYRDTLLEAGLPVLGERHGEYAGYVGYWSPAAEAVHLVSVLAQGGETLVFISSGQVAPLLEGAPEVPGWIPLPEETEEPTVLTFQMEGATQYTLSGRLAGMSVPGAAELLQRTFEGRGWSVQPLQEPGELAAELEVHRGGVRGLVMVRQAPSLLDAEVYLSLTERMRAPAGHGPEAVR